MKRILFALLGLFLFPFNAFAKLNVVASIPTFAALAQEVGKDLIDVKSLARGDQDPHFLEPKPSYAVLLNRADLLIEDGLELEIGWLPVLQVQSRNPKIQTSARGHLDASEGLEILEIPSGKVSRAEGDVHPLGNPHYWLNPKNGLIIARHIADRLKELDPTNASTYEENYRQFEQRLRGKIAVWEKELAPFRGKKIITYHKSFSYFADWSGIIIVDFVEPKPGIPPNPGHLLELIDRIKADKIPMILSENYYEPKASQQLAEKTGAKFLIVPTSVNGDPAVKTYEDLFENLIQKLKENL
jgi:zinc/manganese transport system substrate-binding protein